MEDIKTPLLESISCSPSNNAEQKKIDSDSHIKMPCIYKVPPMLRGLSEEAYTPRLVTIGPFHYQNNLLSSMESFGNWIKFIESVKEVFFKEKILRQHINIKNAEIFEAETSIGLRLVNIKPCYAEINFPGDDRDFFLMILRDACFIIKLFQLNQRRDHSGSSSSDYHHEGLSKILNTPWLKKGIEQDLILLENQLPYFVLLHLYDKYFKQASPDKLFTNLALNFFSIESSSLEKTLEENVPPHLTDLMRMSLIPTTKYKAFGTVSEYPRSATKLDTAGIKFVLAGEDTPLTQVESNIPEFQLYLPCLPSPKSLEFKLPEFVVRDDTVCKLRNIMAFEQYYHSDEPYVCSYVMLMHKLIKTKEDADLLMDKKIIKHLVGGDEDVVNLFAKLSSHIEIPVSYYAVDCDHIIKFYGNTLTRMMASIRRTYLKDAWTIGSTILGLVLFVFSVTSTIKSIFY